ncbi:MAG: AtpZ/AtpI family protein [Flavobacteriales bacterium]|jgi:F0F1-type ATP synthase assembly protein I|nr:AtpZ/AtpI family protein [Flavobacteriales bacterium]
MKKPKIQKNIKNYAVFSGIAIQMAATIWLGNLLGKWLDGKFPNEGEWYSKGITLLAIFLSIYSIIHQVNKMSKN